MGSLFQALGSLAQSYGTAGLNARADQERRDELAKQQAQQDAYLKLAQLREQREKTKFDMDTVDIVGAQPYTRDGRRYIQRQRVSTGQPFEQDLGPVDTEGISALRDIVSEDPRFTSQLSQFASASLKARSGDTKAALKDVLDERNRLRSEADRSEQEDKREKAAQAREDAREKAAQKRQNQREARADARASKGVDDRGVADKAKDVQSGAASLKDFPTKERGAIATYMRENKMTAKPVLSADERKLRDNIEKTTPKIEEMTKFLEDNNLTDVGRGGMFSVDALYQRSKMQKAWEEYSHGLPPKDEKLSKLIKFAAALKIMGAAPWMSIGRGKYLYTEISQHLPQTTDTPAQLYDKAQFFKSILDDAKSSIPTGDSEDSGTSGWTPVK